MSDLDDMRRKPASSTSRKASTSGRLFSCRARIARRVVGRGPEPRSVKRADPLEDVGGQRRGRSLVQIEDLAPEMRPAGDLGHAAAVQSIITDIGISLKETAKAGEMGQRVRGGSVGREAIPGRARCRAAGRPVVGRIDPQPPGRGLAPAGVEYRHRRVVGVNLVGLEHFVADAADDGVEEPGSLSGPARQRRAVDV